MVTPMDALTLWCNEKGTLAWEDQWKGETLWARKLAIFYPTKLCAQA